MSNCRHRHFLLLAAALLLAAPAHAQQLFVVKDLKIEGLQRISDGAVFNYLPVNIGDELDATRVQEALRAVYSSGFFTDVEMRRDGDMLVIVVRERPAIASFEISGNKDIKTEDLEDNLRRVGLATGESFDRSVLDEVEQFLTQEYFARGKYGAQVETAVTEVEGNQVKVAVNITEGARAKIRQINIVGNELFDDKELLEEFSLTTGSLLSFYKKDNLYSREALSGDLESLRSYYMDRGYANFNIDSTQVAISPDKKQVYITVNLEEGDTFQIADVSLSGDLVVPEAQLKQLVLLKPGQTFSAKLLTQTNELINFRLGQDGYARSDVQPFPELNQEERTISLNLRVIPGERVYVRNINFDGSDSVNDDVFRREMRQMESAWLSNTGVERSKERIRRLPFIEEVEVETTPVPGENDMVDVNFAIKEGLPGQFGGGIGYSGSQGVLLNGNFTHSNFLGSGNRVSVDLNSGRFSKIYSIDYTDPYVTPDGVSRRVGLAYSDVTQFTTESSDFGSEVLGATLEYGLPISEFSRIRFGVNLQDNELVAGQFSSRQATQWVNNNGSSFEGRNDDGGPCGLIDPLQGDICGTEFNAFEIFAGWVYDSRDRFIFPSRGMRQSLSLTGTAPGSDIEYYVARYDFNGYWPVFGDFILNWNVGLGFGDAINDTTALPPSKNFFAGGPDSVRGFRQSRLGPVDSIGNPYGGNVRTISQLELILPTPERFARSARASLFFDTGNVFSTDSTQFTEFPSGAGANPIEYDFSLSDLRQSVGVAVQWLAPLGTFRFSYAAPLNKEEGRRDPNGFIILPGDDIERFQFSVGRTF